MYSGTALGHGPVVGLGGDNVETLGFIKAIFYCPSSCRLPWCQCRPTSNRHQAQTLQDSVWFRNALYISNQLIKSIFSVFFGWGSAGPLCGGPGDCPPHHCSRDVAVIHGYCCGCARYSGKYYQLLATVCITNVRTSQLREMFAIVMFRIPDLLHVQTIPFVEFSCNQL
jgi:hypothetical protein